MPRNPKFCELCGYRLSKESAYCPHCGKLNEGSPLIEEEKKKKQEDEKMQEKEKLPAVSKNKEDTKKQEEKEKQKDTSSSWKKRMKPD